jgi:hypothetical protein
VKQDLRQNAEKESAEARRQMEEVERQAAEHVEHVDRVEYRCEQRKSCCFVVINVILYFRHFSGAFFGRDREAQRTDIK